MEGAVLREIDGISHQAPGRAAQLILCNVGSIAAETGIVG
jgi:hypothetical protein